MSKERLKDIYNKLLEREQKALTFFCDDSIAFEFREKYIPEYKDLLAELGDTLQQIGFWTPEELEFGFGKEKQETLDIDTFKQHNL